MVRRSPGLFFIIATSHSVQAASADLRDLTNDLPGALVSAEGGLVVLGGSPSDGIGFTWRTGCVNWQCWFGILAENANPFVIPAYAGMTMSWILASANLAKRESKACRVRGNDGEYLTACRQHQLTNQAG